MAELPTQRDFEDYGAWTGRDVLGPDGERLGAVELIFLDEATDRPEWVLVKLDDGGDTAFVPLAGASIEERSIRVEQARGQVAAAPRPDAHETLSVDQERRLYEHYGLAYSQQASSTVLPEGAAAAQPTEQRPRLRRFASTQSQATERRPTEAAAAAQSPTAEPAKEARPTEQRATPEPPDPEPDQTPAPAGGDAPDTKGTGVTQPPSSASPPPTPIPPPAPTVLPPEGGFQGAEGDEGADGGGRLGFLKRRPALPVALAGAIAGLIAVLALRRRR